MPAPVSYFALSYSEPKRMMVVLARLDDLDETEAVTVACIFDGTWGAQTFRNLAGSAVHADDALWITSKDGEIVRSQQGDITRARLPDSGSLGRHLGQPNQIRKIGGRFYICGLAGQV